MDLHFSQKQRIKRIDEVYNFIKLNQPISISRVMGYFSSIGRQTLQDYVKVLSNSKKIRPNENGLFVTIE
jgi:hypothetical protein